MVDQIEGEISLGTAVESITAGQQGAQANALGPWQGQCLLGHWRRQETDGNSRGLEPAQEVWYPGAFFFARDVNAGAGREIRPKFPGAFNK